MFGFNAWNRIFERRAKGSTFKVLWRELRMIRAEDGGYDFIRREWGAHETLFDNAHPFAHLSPANELTFLKPINSGDNQAKNLIRKLVDGAAYVTSDISGHRGHAVTLRYKSRTPGRTDVPFTIGLKVDATTGHVIWAADDVIKRTDKKAAKPVYAYVARAMEIMDLLFRMDDLDALTVINARSSWTARRQWVNGLATANTLDMTDEQLTAIAETAFKEARSRAQYPSRDFLHHDNGSARWVRLSDEVYKHRCYEALRRLAKQRLTNELKKRNDCFVKEVISNS